MRTNGASVLCLLVMGMLAGAQEDGAVDQKQMTCAYTTTALVDSLSSAAFSTTKAVLACPKGGIECASSIVSALGSFLKTAGHALNVASCYSKSFAFNLCTSGALDLSGVVLKLGDKAMTVAKGVCKAPAVAAKSVAAFKEVNSQCVKDIGATMLPFTKLALAVTYDIRFCEDAVSDTAKGLCIAAAMAILQNVIETARRVMVAIGNCAEIPGFNRKCGTSVLGIAQYTVNLGDDIYGLTKTCPATAPYLRLYEEMPDDETKFRAFEIPQAISWTISGVLLVMMPFVFSAGRRLKSERRGTPLSQDAELCVD